MVKRRSELLLRLVRVTLGMFGVLCLSSVNIEAYAADITKQIRELKPSVIFVTVTTEAVQGHPVLETGTGFIITSSGYALTANHLIASPDSKVSVTVASRFGTSIPVRVIPTGPSFADAVLIQLPASLGPYHPVHFNDPFRWEAGVNLHALGFPLQSDLSVVNGELSSADGPSGLWQVSVPLNYGNSGGPIMDPDGKVIGMVRGGVSNAQAINYMIPLNLMAPLLIASGLRWPPFDVVNSNSQSLELPGRKPLLSDTTSSRSSNCHEITVISSGIPPVYTKSLECDR